MANSPLSAPLITKVYGTDTGSTGKSTVIFPRTGSYLMAVGTRLYTIDLQTSTHLEYKNLGDSTPSALEASTTLTFEFSNLVSHKVPIVIGI